MIEKKKLETIQKIASSSDGWDVVTALRGPDDENDCIKAATTAVIRYAIFKNGRCAFGYMGMDSEEKVELRKKFNDTVKTFLTQDHFIQHAKMAFRALGLKWNEVNPP